MGEALVVGVVLGWQAVFLLVPLALFLEELSRIAAVDWRSARRCGPVWVAPLTLFSILNWARLTDGCAERRSGRFRMLLLGGCARFERRQNRRIGGTDRVAGSNFRPTGGRHSKRW